MLTRTESTSLRHHLQIRLSDVENRWKNLKEKISERQKNLGKLMPSVFHYVEVREQIVTWICKNEKKFNELISEMSVVSDITVMAEKQEQLKVHNINIYTNIATLMNKMKYGLAPSIVDELFKQKSISYSPRNSDFDIPTFNTINCGKHSLRYQVSHIRSKLDNKLKGSSNIESQFKKNIRKKDLTSLLNNNNSCCNLCNS